MKRDDLLRFYYRAQLHLGLTASEFRGLCILAGLLVFGVAAQELSRRIPAVDEALYQELEAEYHERASRWTSAELIGPPQQQAIESATTPGPVAQAPEKLIDLNTATSEELQTLPRIGPALAARILLHREQFGPFRSVADLEMVRGIGAATMEGLRLMVTATPVPDSLRGG
ncbi:MAG: ComEA family DNA-binding protein [Rhodothermales bacterium]|nr:ComEA family DNA-binding protein [Rhodothermales bacterium]MBO6778203.1 ComEA family DNA-binding protein [Rhodothermales bacterium]